jgi:hypothetical protein
MYGTMIFSNNQILSSTGIGTYEDNAALFIFNLKTVVPLTQALFKPGRYRLAFLNPDPYWEC